MELNTKYHGVRNYKEEDCIFFKKGLPGFEEYKSFIIFPVEGNEIFQILHSVENEELGLVLVSPFQVIDEYEFELKDSVLEELKIQNKEDIMVWTTVTLHSNIKQITTNLRAPIVINGKERVGEQIILEKEEYLVKSPLFKEEI